MSDRKALIRTFYERYVAGDSDGALGMLAEDVTWQAPDCLPYGDLYHGRAGVLNYATTAASWYDFILVEVDDVVDASADRSIAVGTFGGRAKATGTDFRVPFCQTWEFRGDQGAALRYVNDSGAVLRALGVGPRALGTPPRAYGA